MKILAADKNVTKRYYFSKDDFFSSEFAFKLIFVKIFLKKFFTLDANF